MPDAHGRPGVLPRSPGNARGDGSPRSAAPGEGMRAAVAAGTQGMGRPGLGARDAARARAAGRGARGGPRPGAVPGRGRSPDRRSLTGAGRDRAAGAGLRARLTDALGLPRDIVFDLPRITLLGALQLTVENHQGLREFAPGRVVIATRSGLLRVEGEDLRLGVLREGEVSIAGRLHAVRLQP